MDPNDGAVHVALADRLPQRFAGVECDEPHFLVHAEAAHRVEQAVAADSFTAKMPSSRPSSAASGADRPPGGGLDRRAAY
jgi:hypothetical protein